MKKYIPVLLILAAGLLSACGAPKNEDGNYMGGKIQQQNEKKSLKELIGLGTSQKCTYEINEEGNIMKGEIIVSGEKFKQDTEITNEEGTIKVYAISDGTYLYSWNNVTEGMGNKMKIDMFEGEGEDEDEIEEEGEKEAVDWNERVDYKCSPTTINGNEFAIPSDIEFVDYSETMKQMQNIDVEQFKDMIPEGMGE